MRRTTWRGSLGAAVLAGAIAIAAPARADVHISIGGWFDIPLPVAYVPPPVYVAPWPQPIAYAPPAYPVWYRHKHGPKHHGYKHWRDDWD
jgi:hypothetical protein